MDEGPSTSRLREETSGTTDLEMEEYSSDDEKTFTSLQTALFLPDHLENDEPEFEESYGTGKKILKVKRTKEEEQVLTNKFLSGELSFTEFAAQYEDNDYEENFDDEDDVKEKSDDEELTESWKEDLPKDIQKNIALGKESTSGKRRLKGGEAFKRNNLPPALKGLIGEANLRYARGELDTAIQMCFEVIRQFCHASEPYETLAQIYEEQGNSETSLKMSMLAAYANPRASKHVWIDLAEKFEDLKDFKQATACYNSALKCDLKDIEIHLKHIALLERIGDSKNVLNAKFKLVKYADPKKNGEQLIQLAKMLAQKFHEENKLEKAKEALEVVFKKCPKLVTTELINIMLEILISLRNYKKCIELMVKFCDLEVEGKTSDDDFIIKGGYEPPDLNIDIFTKLVIVIIHLRFFHMLDTFLKVIHRMNLEEFGDIYFEVAEALILEEKFVEAVELLIPLTKSSNYDLPAIWLRLAECYKALNQIENSIESYTVVIERAPQLLSARLAVSELLNNIGRRKQALEFLTQEKDSEIFNPALIYERCQLLQGLPDQKKQFVEVVHLFLSRHFAHINHKDELIGLLTLRSDRKRAILQDSKNMQKAFEVGEEIKGEFTQTFKEPPIEEEWQMFVSACEICVELERYDTLQRLVFSAQGSQKFLKFSQLIDLLCLSACYYNCDAYFGYNTVRAVVLKNLNCHRAWNMFNLMILRADDSRHNRFLMRLLIRNPDHRALTVLHANNCLVSGTYKYALSDYTSVYQKENSAMMAFLIAVTLCQMACQKFSAKKHSLVTQSVAYFWKYKELRGREGLQESYYNIGRAFHQLGLLPPAIHHYKKALEIKSEFLDNYNEHLDLKREAAFNLHLIYLFSGARDIARMYLEKYCVI